MKALRFFAPLFLTALVVRADIIVEEKIETAGSSTPAIVKIKGDRLRIDIGAASSAAMATLIVDLAGGMAVKLETAQKAVSEVDLASVRRQSQTLGAKVEKPVATGQTEKIGDWNTEIYQTHSAGIAYKMWVTKDLPNLESLKEQLGKLSQAGASQGDLAQFELPGVVVKTEIAGSQGKITSTILSIRETTVAESEVNVPPDYQKVIPTGLPAPLPQ